MRSSSSSSEGARQQRTVSRWSVPTCPAPLQALSARRNIVAAPVLVKAPPVKAAAAIDCTIEAKARKLKTRKAAAKRFKVTAKGKVMARRSGKQHINEKMSSGHLRRLGKEKAVFAGDVRPYLRAATFIKGLRLPTCADHASDVLSPSGQPPHRRLTSPRLSCAAVLGLSARCPTFRASALVMMHSLVHCTHSRACCADKHSVRCTQQADTQSSCRGRTRRHVFVVTHTRGCS